MSFLFYYYCTNLGKKFANLQLQYTQTFWRIFPYDRGVTNLGFQFAKNLQTCSCKWWPVQMRACKQDSSNSASILSWVIKAVKVVLCQINKFCKQLTQNTTTDLWRFTQIVPEFKTKVLQVFHFRTTGGPLLTQFFETLEKQPCKQKTM